MSKTNFVSIWLAFAVVIIGIGSLVALTIQSPFGTPAALPIESDMVVAVSTVEPSVVATSTSAALW